MNRMNKHLVRKVWAAVTKCPQASIQELATAVGIPYGPCRRSLIDLKRRGYIDFPDNTVRARTILIPLWEGCNASTINTH